MNKHNSRKEPTFGEPRATQTEIDFSENQDALELPKVSISLGSKQAPNYTFTPVPTRPAELAKENATFEEQVRLNQTEETPAPITVPPVSSVKFAPVEDEQPSEVPTQAAPIAQEPAQETTPDHDGFERVIPAVAAAPKARWQANIAPKYRRLGVVCLLGLVLLLIFFWLKPSPPETVEQLQQQGTSLPIEFRPVDEEEAKRAEAEAKALQEAQAKAAAEALAQQQAQQTPPVPEQTQPPVQNVASEPVPPSQPQPVEVKQPEPAQPNTSEQMTTVAPPPKPTSVIHQPEEKPAAPKPVERKVEKPKPTTPPKPKVNNLDQLVQVVDAKPAATSTAAASTKVLTVQKGVSLMQVFRDNKLNIADVNAMSKVNNVVSNLKVGEKVTVKLDKNNRVVEMSIGSGGKFVRQANGTYQFK